MNQNKELVFKDLSARLLHHVRVKIWLKDGTTEEGFLDLEHNYGDVLKDAFFYHNKIKDIKPYLRPLSSMTEEERKEYLHECDKDDKDALTTPRYHGIDWLNKKMFAYQTINGKDMFELGLAIAVTEDNNPYKEK